MNRMPKFAIEMPEHLPAKSAKQLSGEYLRGMRDYEELETYEKEHGLINFEKVEALLKEHDLLGSWVAINDIDVVRLEITERKFQKMLKIFELVRKRGGYRSVSTEYLDPVSKDAFYLAAMVADANIIKAIK